MAASNYLQLTNRVLNALNEVELDSTNFSTAVGFYSEARNAINQGLFDFYSYEGVKWPFLFTKRSIAAVRGTFDYDQAVLSTDIDWESFRIERQTYTITVTQTGGIATAITDIPHNIQTNDTFYIDNANEIGYNTPSVAVIVTGASTFTYPVDVSTPTPGTGTIIAKSNTVLWKRLYPIDINEYRQSYASVMENLTSDNFDIPRSVVRDQDNKITILPAPIRAYTVSYDAFTIPTGLVDQTDTHLVPEQYEQGIVDFGLHYAYMFRDNADEAQLALKRAEDRVRRAAKALMPVQLNVNWG